MSGRSPSRYGIRKGILANAGTGVTYLQLHSAQVGTLRAATLRSRSMEEEQPMHVKSIALDPNDALAH